MEHLWDILKLMRKPQEKLIKSDEIISTVVDFLTYTTALLFGPGFNPCLPGHANSECPPWASLKRG